MSRLPRPNTLRWLQQELPEWEREGLLSAESAAALRTRYQTEKNQTHQLGLVLISAFGACLIGAGVISLFAYNWDMIGRPARTVLALLPLIITQVLAFLTLARWPRSAAMRESVCGGLILAIGAAIALVAQTYQIGGDFAQFMLTWFALSLPAVYLLRSGLGFWLCQIALIVWICYAQWHAQAAAQWYPLIFATTIPYYFWIRTQSERATQTLMAKNALALAIPIGLVCWLDSVPGDAWQFIFTAYFAAGLLLDQSEEPLRARPFAVIGALGLSLLLLVLSEYGSWIDDGSTEGGLRRAVCIVLGLGWLVAIIKTILQNRYWLLSLGIAPLIVLLSSLNNGSSSSELFSSDPLPASIVTIYTFAAGITVLIAGMSTRRLPVLNLGLILLGTLAILKFFDSELGLVIKGTVFIIIGCLFIATNLITVLRFRKGNRHA